MFKSISIHNFKCIKDLMVDFSYDGGKAPNGYKESQNHIFFQAKANKADRVVPVFAIYGPNASGKSTVIDAISILRRIILKGVDSFLFIPNKIASIDKDDGTKFKVQFYCNNKLCSISLSFNESSIVEEELSINGDKIYCVKNSEIAFLNDEFSRWNDGLNDTFKTQCVNVSTNQQENTLLEKIRKNYPGISKDIISVYNFFESQFIVLQKNAFLLYHVLLDNLSKTYVEEQPENRKNKAISDLVGVLNKLDVGITSLSIEEVEFKEFIQSHPNARILLSPDEIVERVVQSSANASGHKMTDIRPFHKNVNGQEVEFVYEEESAGTKRLIQMLLQIMYALRTGKDLLIDEIDNSLHPLLVIEIVRMLKSKRVNSLNSQLICNLHNTELLSEDLLGASEVGMMSYTKKEGSILTKLSKVKGIRSKDNLRNKYIRGDFGGLPFPYI